MNGTLLYGLTAAGLITLIAALAAAIATLAEQLKRNSDGRPDSRP
jgi:hypothetical protein